MTTRNKPKHWRFEKDYSKLTLSQLQILALRAFPSSPRQLAIRAEIEKRMKVDPMKPEQVTGFTRFDAMLDRIATEKLITLAKLGNMVARQALVERRNAAEQVATLHSFRLVAGQKGLDTLFESIQKLTAIIATIPKVAKVGIAKRADEIEMEKFLYSENPDFCPVSDFGS